MQKTKPETILILSLQQLIGVILLLGYVSIALSFYSSHAHPFKELDRQVNCTSVKSAKGTDESDILIKLCSIIEDTAEEEIEMYSGDRLSAKSLLNSLHIHFQNLYIQSHILGGHSHAYYKDWCASKRLTILTRLSSLHLYLLHALKLPC